MTIEAETPETALITKEDVDKDVIFGEGKTSAILAAIREQCADVLPPNVPDLSTQKGRKALKSAAYKVSRSKTLLDDAGKAYGQQLKETVKRIDHSRKTIRDTLDALRDEIRAPVEAIELEEQNRASEIAVAINKIITAGSLTPGASADIEAVLARIRGTEINEETFGDKMGEAALAKDVAVSNLERALTAAKEREEKAAEEERQREAERAELEELRRKDEERAQQEQKERLAERQRLAENQAAATTPPVIDASDLSFVSDDGKTLGDALGLTAEDLDAQGRINAENRERERQREEHKTDEERDAAHEADHTQRVADAIADLVEWTDASPEQAAVIVTLIDAGRIRHCRFERR